MEEMENRAINDPVGIETKANGSQVFNEPYSPEAIQRLQSLVNNFYQQGEKKYYSINVDGETVVAKNCDARKFNRYLPFVSEHTKKVEVKLYAGYSPKCNTYIFYIHRGLSGVPQQTNVDVQVEINKALEQDRLQNELDQLRREVEKKDKKLKKLKGIKDAIPEWPDMLKGLIRTGVEAAGTLGFTRRPSLQGIPEQHAPETEVEVEMEGEDQSSEAREAFETLYEQLGEEQMVNLFNWMTAIGQSPKLQQKIQKEFEEMNQKKQNNGEA